MSGMPAFDGGSSGSVVLGVTNGTNVGASAVDVFLVSQQMALVNVNASITGALVGGDTLFTLPVGARPPALPGLTVFGTLVRTSDNANIRVQVNSAGVVSTQNALASGVILRGQIVIPL